MDINQRLEDILLTVSKPTRYMGKEFNSISKDTDKIKAHVALAFPDVYEVGMSHLGLKILYHLLNEEQHIFAERVFAPWVDMEAKMRDVGLPLFSLESRTLIKDFDFLGFTLQYEMSYTNITNMLDLSGIAIFSRDRSEDDPLVIAGGPCGYNPEPLADFIDFFVIGEAEEAILEIMSLYIEHKEKGGKRKEFLSKVATVPGVYVPSFYEVTYNDNGTINKIIPRETVAAARVTKRVISDMDNVYYPTDFVVPYMDIVHDRAVLEVFRGCSHGCRFCQAGMVYRPVREKSSRRLSGLASKIIDSTGYGELSLASLSTSDYSNLRELSEVLTQDLGARRVGLSLPSLRVDAFSLELAEKVQEMRKSGLTFAPEAGTQRLRDVINKGVTAEDLLSSMRDAFLGGWNTVKLYFMIGLPTETAEDLEGIAELANSVVRVYREVNGNNKGLKVTVSTSTFVPKPHTPFQWSAQIPLPEITQKQRFFKGALKNRSLRYSWHEGELSLLEAVFSRGDRRLSKVLALALEKGIRFDGWREIFDFDKWREVFDEAGLSMDFYALRERSLDEVLPWDIIDSGIDKSFLKRELEKALRGETTPNCGQYRCNACGITRIKGGEICEGKA